MKRAFNHSLEKAAKEKAFIPSKSLKLKKPSEMIVDNTGLSDLTCIAPEIIVKFINQKESINFEIDSFVNSKLQLAKNLSLFGATSFNSEHLKSFFLSSIFKDNHQISENFSLIEYFYRKGTKEKSNEWNEKIKGLPFIYTKDKELKSPQTLCFPTIAFETVFATISQTGADKVLDRAKALYAMNPNFTPVLNMMGYAYSEKGDLDNAGKMLQEQVRRASGSANPYDSMGDYYLAINDKTAALKYFEQSAKMGLKASVAKADSLRSEFSKQDN